MRSEIAGAPPLYGTWDAVVPVFCQNSAAVRWSEEPAPLEAKETLSGFFFRLLDEFGDAVRRHAGIRHQHVRRAHRDHHQVEVLSSGRTAVLSAGTDWWRTRRSTPRGWCSRRGQRASHGPRRSHRWRRGWFSTTKVWPRLFVMLLAMVRAMVSVRAARRERQTIVTGFSGKAAWAGRLGGDGGDGADGQCAEEFSHRGVSGSG